MAAAGGVSAPGPRAAQIARLIEAEIVRRDWPIGASLGSEQALQEQYGVSRSVLREAVRLVEHHQVAKMRRGPNGGLFVTAPGAGPASRAVVIYLEYLGTGIDELLDARLLLEPLAAGVAAERIDEAGIARLRAIVTTSMAQPEPDDFNVAIAQLTGNVVLELFVDVLARLTARHAPDLPIAPAAIVEAIAAGDSARAKTLTADHLRTVAGLLHGHRRRTRSGAPPDPVPGKRAEVLAAAIHEDVAAGGWRIGSVLGAESDLLERYGTSRSVLREAVRLLEHHAVARMRRGPGGGLTVTEPQPGPAVDTFARYLEYRHPTREDVWLVRDAIERQNVSTVVGQRAFPAVAAFLASYRAEVPAEHKDPRMSGVVEANFHDGLAELAGNRVHNLFLRILAELPRRHWAPRVDTMPSDDDVAEMHHAHARIVDAIAEGDDSLAQHRSRRHLEALSAWWR